LLKEFTKHTRLTYKTHKVDFKFVKVLKQILEEENLIKDAYIEEIKYSFERFAKSLDSAFNLGPDIKRFMDDSQIFLKKRQPRSIFASGVFIGSVLLYETNEFLGLVGMISSVIIMGAAGFFRRH